MANRWTDNSSVKRLRKGTKSNGRQSITRINIRTSCRRARKNTTRTSNNRYARLVIGTSRTVGSAKKFVRITSGFGGGEFPKTLRQVCTCQKLKFAFLLLEYCKIRECYAVANAFTIKNTDVS